MNSRVIMLAPANWKNKSFPLFNEISTSSSLRSGRWLVVLYHYDCDSCLEAIARYRAVAVSGAAKDANVKVAFVAMPPVPAGADPAGSCSDCLHLALRPDHDWLGTTPLVIALDQGRVLQAEQGKQALEPLVIPAWHR
jgi:hypothetical protein